MTGTGPQPAGGMSAPHPDSRPATATMLGKAATDSGNTVPGIAGAARRLAAGAAAAPVTGKPHKPCSHPPKRRPAAYDRRPAAGPGRTPRRAQRQSAETRQVRVELPDEPPRLTPEAALALLRVLLQARAARRDRGRANQVTDNPGRSAVGSERKG
jgi:hypothetical protein